MNLKIELEHIRKEKSRMKLSDYVAKFLASLGIKQVFVFTGGASAHIIDSIAKEEQLEYICHQHEQASAMAADAYARVTGNIGVAVATSGPGATNLLTGCCCAYYDSVPVLFITGQVSSFRFKGDLGIRQYGFQETDTVDIFKYVTKYSVLIDDPKKIRYELEKAVYLARNGRKGPVLVDIPDNYQRMDINPEELEGFIPNTDEKKTYLSDEIISQCVDMIRQAQRPVLVLGWGIRLGKAEEELNRLINLLNIPVLQTWAMMDFLPYDNRLNIGSFGLHGTRYGNFTVQNADLILAIGTRLDTHLTGSPISDFAREAKKIVVDIDNFELDKFSKFGLNVDVLVNEDAKIFINTLADHITSEDAKQISDNASEWKEKINIWKKRYEICPSQYFEEEKVNPYVFVKMLSKQLSDRSVIFVDTGCSIAWMLQAFEFKNNQRLFSAFNNTPMGYALPASTGASFALEDKEVICVTGDGGFQINIQELATIMRHNLPIKIFVINNRGYSMIKQTQDQWFDSRYEASTIASGLGMPDFVDIAKAYGLNTFSIKAAVEINDTLAEVLSYKGPVLCNVDIDLAYKVIPQVKFGRPIEDTEPLLERKEFLEQMLIEPLDISKK